MLVRIFLALLVLCIASGCAVRKVAVKGDAGAPGIPGNDGRDGVDGKDGADGKDGTNGSSCTVSQVSNGALISCEDGSSVVVLNGDNSAYSIVELIDPCGVQSSFDEVLLRTANGTLIAHFSHGNKQFLTVIGSGSYVTTDGTNCAFFVDSNLQVVW